MIEKTLNTLIESVNQLTKTICLLPEIINNSSKNKEIEGDYDGFGNSSQEDSQKKTDITLIKQKVIEQLTQNKVDRSAIKAVITSFGVESLDDLREEDYSSFMESLENLSETI